MRARRIGGVALVIVCGCSEHAVLDFGASNGGEKVIVGAAGEAGTGDSSVALRLGGATAQLRLASAPEFDFSNHFTIEAWIWPYPDATGDMLFCKADAARESKEVRLVTADAVPVINLNMASAPSPASLRLKVGLSESVWHHLAISYGNGQLLSFVDGQLAASVGRLDPVEDGTGDWYFGACPREGGVLSGRELALSDVRFSRVARYTADFVPDPRLPPDADAMALFKLDHASTTNVVDSGPHTLAGEVLGAAAWVTLPARSLP